MTVGSSDHHPLHPQQQQHGPTAVHHPRPHHHSIPREQTREHEKDVLGLRLALGSILSPKRLSTPSSHASSGTASPCPAHFGPGLVHPYHPGPSHLHTPIESEDVLRHHTASVATIQEETGEHDGVRSRTGTPPKKSSPVLSRANSSTDPLHHPQEDHTSPPPILTTSNVHSLSPQQAQSVKESQNSRSSGARERQRIDSHHPHPHPHPHPHSHQHKDVPGHRGGFGAYIATLQSARAWDALVHGNMS